MVVLDAARVPVNDENDKCRHDAEQLNEAVEEKVAVKAARIKPGEDGNAENCGKPPPRDLMALNVSVHMRSVSSCSVKHLGNDRGRCGR